MKPLVLLTAFVVLAAACTSAGDDSPPVTVAVPESVVSPQGAEDNPPQDPTDDPAEDPSRVTTSAVPAPTPETAPTTASPDEAAPATPEELPEGLPGSLLILDGTARPAVIDLSSGTVTDPSGGAPATFAQPTWGPGGLVWTETSDEDGSVAFSIAVQTGGSTTRIATPFAPYYYYWAPDGSAVAFLGSDAAGQRLGLLDVSNGEVGFIATGSPYYFDWAPDSTRLLANVTGTELGYVDLDGSVQDIAFDLGLFQAPQWAPDGSAIAYVARVAGGLSAGAASFRAQTVTGRLVVVDTESGTATEVARFDGTASFAFAPSGTRMAFSVTDLERRIQFGVDYGPLWVADLEDGGDPVELTRDGVLAFQWSPDGTKLLFAAAPSLESPDLEWRVWDGNETVTLATFLPTSTFVTQYLPFWDQFSRSTSLWSPDSEWITYADRQPVPERIMIARADGSGEPLMVVPGSVSSWSSSVP